MYCHVLRSRFSISPINEGVTSSVVVGLKCMGYSTDNVVVVGYWESFHVLVWACK